jgi:hypothetical protein
MPKSASPGETAFANALVAQPVRMAFPGYVAPQEPAWLAHLPEIRKKHAERVAGAKPTTVATPTFPLAPAGNDAVLVEAAQVLLDAADYLGPDSRPTH